MHLCGVAAEDRSSAEIILRAGKTYGRIKPGNSKPGIFISPESPKPGLRPSKQWSWRRDLNPRPSDYKSDALPAELRQPNPPEKRIRMPSSRPEKRADTLPLRTHHGTESKVSTAPRSEQTGDRATALRVRQRRCARSDSGVFLHYLRGNRQPFAVQHVTDYLNFCQLHRILRPGFKRTHQNGNTCA